MRILISNARVVSDDIKTEYYIPRGAVIIYFFSLCFFKLIFSQTMHCFLFGLFSFISMPMRTYLCDSCELALWVYHVSGLGGATGGMFMALWGSHERRSAVEVSACLSVFSQMSQILTAKEIRWRYDTHRRTAERNMMCWGTSSNCLSCAS